MKTIMKLSSLRLTCLLLAGGAMILFSGCQQEEPLASENQNLTVTTETQTRASGPSANGQGSLIFGIDTPRRFSFHAREKNNGTIQGSGVLTYTAGELKIHFDIDCLAITGNTAIMSGVVTRYQEFPDRVGWEIWFKAEDNGEGANADPDRLTLAFVNPDLEDCSFDYGIALNPILGGNIQVKP